MKKASRNRLPSRSRITVGQVVSFDETPELMTVEAIAYGAFGPIASCVYFDDSQSLREVRLPVRVLVQRTQQKSVKRVEANSVVRLRSGSPEMQIISLNRSANRSICVWTGIEGVTRKRQFAITALTGISSEIEAVTKV